MEEPCLSPSVPAVAGSAAHVAEPMTRTQKLLILAALVAAFVMSGLPHLEVVTP